MAGDIKPTLSLNWHKHLMRQMPELKLKVDYIEGKNKYSITNFSPYSAYQVYIFAFENHHYESSVQLIAQAGDLIAPDEMVTVESYIEYPFIGCMSYKEYWVEFSDVEGNHYRFSSGSDNSGIGLAGFKKIKKRTAVRGKIIKKKGKISTMFSDFIFRIRYKIKT